MHAVPYFGILVTTYSRSLAHAWHLFRTACALRWVGPMGRSFVLLLAVLTAGMLMPHTYHHIRTRNKVLPLFQTEPWATRLAERALPANLTQRLPSLLVPDEPAVCAPHEHSQKFDLPQVYLRQPRDSDPSFGWKSRDTLPRRLGPDRPPLPLNGLKLDVLYLDHEMAIALHAAAYRSLELLVQFLRVLLQSALGMQHWDSVWTQV